MSKTLTSSDLDGVAEYIKTHNPKNIVLCVGAGISTNSGIPDFRTPGTGLYSNLAKLNLPYPEAVFSLVYFRQDPEPFYTLAQGLYPGAFKPTLTHTFMRLLQEKEILLRCFTQNIDTLERIAGVESDRIVEAHGSFATSRCIDCSKEFPSDKMKEIVEEKKIARCPECKGLVKPDIVFFGEALPARFFARRVDMHNADMVFIIGTSLVVHPFAALPNYTHPHIPRILFNFEPVEDLDRPNDVWIEGDCDESIWKLCQKLGWETELQELHEKIGGVERKWHKDATAEEEGPGGEEEERVAAEDTVEQLARELAEELRLDQEEDVELKKEEDREVEEKKKVEGDKIMRYDEGEGKKVTVEDVPESETQETGTSENDSKQKL